ncbi:Oligopeptide transporter 1 [Linum perenne]
MELSQQKKRTTMATSTVSFPDPDRVKTEEEEEEVNDNPIEQVRLTVPITDDPTQPVLTFRTWVLGILACALLAFVNQFFGYRQNQLSVGSVTAQIVVLPLGKLMAATLPTKKFRFPFSDKTWSLNPGPFNMKEHALITILASCGASGVYAIYIITMIKAFYKRQLHPGAAFLLAQTTQLLGYGWAGLFRKILVDSPFMWWPSNLVQVSLFEALHETDKRVRGGGMTRLQFFMTVFVCSFAYYIIPGYLMPSISTISVICLVWTRSVTAQQVGSGLNGLGLASFGLDWATVSSFLGSPIAYPLHVIFNSFFGFLVLIYVVLPIAYWGNFHNAKRFPIFSSNTFDGLGHPYDIDRIIDAKDFQIDLKAYDSYSKVNLSIFFAFVYGLSFATLTATISHVALFDGKDLFRKATAASKARFADVHTRIMKKNYEVVPQWWFILVLGVSFVLALVAVEGFGKQLQLPWWGLVLACILALVCTLPIGIVQATTNNQVGLNVITELMIGYAYPGKPLANVAFKTYGYISMSQALSFVQDFKLGHYMKIPPKSMFIAQLVGTLVGSTVHFATAWWILSSVPHVCGSPWTCPGSDVFYSASIIWGVVSPRRMFGDLGIYKEQYWFFLVGALAPVPVWFLSRKFPEKRWIKLIHMPVILGASSSMPPARAVHYWTWAAVGVFFNYFVYNRHKGWWAKHAYILSAAMDAGVAFMGILLFFALNTYDVYGPEWWGLEASDHCTLAKCPTAPGVVVKGCPAVV